MGIKVYLAGKISKNCWRHNFVKGLKDVVVSPREEWPILEDAISTGVDYCGPYFASCDHGCSHQPQSHGVIEGDCCSSYSSQLHKDHSGEGDCEARRYVFQQCWDSINSCDCMIAVLEKDSFGTLVEVDWAYALKKDVFIVDGTRPGEISTDEWIHRRTRHPGEMWFAHLCDSGALDEWMRDDVGRVVSFIGVLANEATLKKSVSLCESPMEEKFITEYINRGLSDLKVAVDVGPYRLDFADCKNKIAIEIDGFEYHSSKDHIIKDRERQRNLEKMGWKVVRFAGSEVHRDVAKCVNDFIQIRSRHLQS